MFENKDKIDKYHTRLIKKKRRHKLAISEVKGGKTRNSTDIESVLKVKDNLNEMEKFLEKQK